MNRYFMEVSYIGTHYAGFQIQQNAKTIQGEIENVLSIYFRQPLMLTGSSRTDAGVHSHQNFFHFDSNIPEDRFVKSIYNLNALLPADIAVISIKSMRDEAHARFDATSRLYHYNIHLHKAPFINGLSYYFPYPLDLVLMQQAADIIKAQTDFTSFSKKNTQVNNHICTIYESTWLAHEDGKYKYVVQANRFLRGMVKGLTGTMLAVGRQKMALNVFESIFSAHNNQLVDFSPPGEGLFLMQVNY